MKHTTKFIFFAVFFYLPTRSLSQSTRLEKYKNHFGLELSSYAIVPAHVTTHDSYKLKSSIQSLFSLGINYKVQLKKKMHFITGLHINVGKRNFHYQIPGQDLQYFSGFEDGYYLENKELWETLSIPMNFQFSIGSQPKKNLRGIIGINLKYSGFMSDEVITSTIYSVNGNSQIFEINLSSNNNGKVWFTINVGLSRSFILDNHNELAIGLLMDLSLHSFYKGSYQFTLPGKPISAGFYSIKGSGIGLSLQYIFKGVNKKEAKKYIR